MHRTAVRIVDLRNDLEQCGFAAAVPADDAKELATVHLERHVLEHLLLLVALDALRPVDERLLEAAGLLGRQLEPFLDMVHIEHDRLVHVVVDCHDVIVVVCGVVPHSFLGHYITSANLRLFLRKTYTPNHSNSTVTTTGMGFTHQESNVLHTVG